MTSTNDGKEVKSYQTSGPKGKTYFIELYKSLESRLSEAGTASERTNHLCEAWRRVHSLCQHSASTTHPHLLSWLQRHTARAVLQTKWQLPERKDDRRNLEEAINVFIVESNVAAASRDGVSPQWEAQLVARGEWFKKVLEHPWKHPVLNCLLNPEGTPPTDNEVLEWLKEERGVTFVMRLHTLVSEKCDDIAMSLATAVMERVRGGTTAPSDLDQSDDHIDKPEQASSFGHRLKEEAGFTVDVWEMLTDIEFVLLHKRDSSLCITLAKQTPLRSAYQLIERLQSRLETSPREKRLWKNSKEVAVLIAQVVIARCMVIPQCTGGARSALYCCSRSLARLMGSSRLPGAAAALAAPAPTAAHLHTLAAAVDAQIAQKNESGMKPFVCELYVRAITAGMNELERLKLKTEKDMEARSMEQTLGSWFVQLGSVLSSSDRIKCECALTAFSVHPSPQMYERIKAAPALPSIPIPDVEETSADANPEFGSWASDSRSQTNFVKTSETLNMKARQNQANVLSTAILTEGEALGLSPELCQDITVLLSGPRVKTLSWDMDRELLLENCRAYLERTHGGTKAVTTELKYLNLNPADFQYLPEEDDDENNIYYGIEKGYEHLVEFQEPEDIWEEACDKADTSYFEKANTSYSSEEFDFIQPQRRRRNKKSAMKSEEDDPLSLVAETKRKEKKERPHSKERSKDKKNATDPLEKKEQDDPLNLGNQEPKKEKPKRERKKKAPKLADGSLANLVGLKVGKSIKSTKVLHIDSDVDSQGHTAIRSLNSDENVLYDGVYSIDDTRSPRSSYSFDNPKTIFNKPCRPASVSGLRIESPSSYKSQSPSDNSRNNSPTNISGAVKGSITKLLEYRRQKALEDQCRKPNAIIRPDGSTEMDKISISPKGVAIPEIPKSYISKQSDNTTMIKQTDQNLNQRLSNTAIPSPVIQYASKQFTSPDKPSQSHYGPRPYNNVHSVQSDRMAPSDRCFSTPPSTDKFLDSVNLISIYDKFEPTHSRNPYDKTSSYPEVSQDNQRRLNVDKSYINYKDYVNEFSLNAYNQYTENGDAFKKVMKPIDSVSPKVPSQKVEHTALQCAKRMPQKKPDGSLNTFARISYYKNKQTDMRKSHEMTQNSQPQTVGSKLDGFILDHLLSQKSVNSQVKNSQARIKLTSEKNQTPTRDHPLLSCILQSKSSPAQNHQNTSFPPTSTLTEKDSDDLLLLLRQQNALNKQQNLSVASSSKSHSMPKSPVAFHAKTSSTGTIYDSNASLVPTSFKPKQQSGMPNEAINKVTEGKIINVLSTSIIKSADKKPKGPKLNPVSTKKPDEDKPKRTKVKVSKKFTPKSELRKTPEEWEDVMNAILKQKTPCRGPNALDMALNKSSFEKAFEDSLRKPHYLFTSPNDGVQQSPMISQTESIHKEIVNITQSMVTGFSSQTVTKTQKTTYTPLKIPSRASLLKTSSKTKKLVNTPLKLTSTVETMIRQQKIEEKTIERLMQNNNIEITKHTTRITVLETPERAHKLSDLGNPTKDIPQRHVEMSKTNVQQNNVEMLKKTVKQSNDEPKEHLKQIVDEIPKKEVSVVMEQLNCAKPDGPFVSGIQNSDYDLLDELMDDDLRKEIGELSSDEETYHAEDFIKDTKMDQKRVGVVFNDATNDNTSMTPITSARQQMCKQNVMPQSISQTATQRLQNKEPMLVTITPAVPTQSKPGLCLKTTNLQNVSTPVMIQSTQASACSSVNVLHSIPIPVEKNMYITVPCPAPVQNVMLIPSELAYENFPSVQNSMQAVPNIGSNTYITSNAPNISVYQSTQFVAPVASPLIITSAVVAPVASNVSVAAVLPIPAIEVTQTEYSLSRDELYQPSHLATNQGNIVVDGNKLKTKTTSCVPNVADKDKLLQKPEIKPITDENEGKTAERKILKEVQEKHADEKIDCKKRSQRTNAKDLETQADQERLKKKRMAILNRKISNFCGIKTIALGYSPLRLLTQVENKNDDAANLNDTKNDLIPTIENNLYIASSEMTSPATPDSFKENKNEPTQARRILLRSSNKLKSKISSVTLLPKPTQQLNKSTTINLNTSIETPSQNEITLDLKINDKQKRVSKRIRNKSVTTPQVIKNKETKVPVQMRRKTPGASKVSKKKINSSSSKIKNQSSNNDLEAKQLLDIETELLGSTIRKHKPINLNIFDPPAEISSCTSIGEKTEELLISDKPVEHLLIKEVLPGLLVNKTMKASEQEDSCQQNIQPIDFEIPKTSVNVASEHVETKIIVDDSAKLTGVNYSVSGKPKVQEIETEVIEEKVDNINASVKDTISIAKQSIQTDNTQTDKVNTLFLATSPGTNLTSEVIPPIEFVNIHTPQEREHYKTTTPVNIAKNEIVSTLNKNLITHVKESSAQTSNVRQKQKMYEHVNSNKSPIIVAPQPQVVIAVDDDNDDVEIVGDVPKVLPQTNFLQREPSQGSIFIGNISSTYDNNPLKKRVRIRLGNGKIFKGTVSGSVDVASLLENPNIKSLLMSQLEQSKKLYSLKLNVHKNSTHGSQISLADIQRKRIPQLPMETVSLLSDDEEDDLPKIFETEYGKHKVAPMDDYLFKKHQKKFMLKSYVSVKNLSLAEENAIKHRSNTELMVDGNTNTQISEECEIKSTPVCSKKRGDIEILSAIPSKYVRGVFNDIDNILAPINTEPKEDPIVLIDDSSNESLYVNNKPETNEKIYELKNMLLKDLGVDNLFTSTNEATDDVQVTWDSEAIDLTEDPVLEATDRKAQAIVKENYQDIINKKCIVKLVRCDDKSKCQPISLKYDEFDESNDQIIPAPLSRSGSFSILEDFPIEDELNKDTAEKVQSRTSPVMEIYDLIASLEKTSTNQNIRGLSEARLECYTEWMSTKKDENLQCMKIKHLVPQSLVVPQLSILVLSYIQKEDFVNKTSFHPSLISLKRKIMPSLVPVAKISKFDFNPASVETLERGSNGSMLDLSSRASSVSITDEIDDVIETAITNEVLKTKEPKVNEKVDTTSDLSDTDATSMTVSDCEDNDYITLMETGMECEEDQKDTGTKIPIHKILPFDKDVTVVCLTDNGIELDDKVTEIKNNSMTEVLDINPDPFKNTIIFSKESQKIPQKTSTEFPIDLVDDILLDLDMKQSEKSVPIFTDLVQSHTDNKNNSVGRKNYDTVLDNRPSKKISTEFFIKRGDDIPIDLDMKQIKESVSIKTDLVQAHIEGVNNSVCHKLNDTLFHNKVTKSQNESIIDCLYINPDELSSRSLAGFSKEHLSREISKDISAEFSIPLVGDISINSDIKHVEEPVSINTDLVQAYSEYDNPVCCKNKDTGNQMIECQNNSLIDSLCINPDNLSKNLMADFSKEHSSREISPEVSNLLTDDIPIDLDMKQIQEPVSVQTDLCHVYTEDDNYSVCRKNDNTVLAYKANKSKIDFFGANTCLLNTSMTNFSKTQSSRKISKEIISIKTDSVISRTEDVNSTIEPEIFQDLHESNNTGDSDLPIDEVTRSGTSLPNTCDSLQYVAEKLEVVPLQKTSCDGSIVNMCEPLIDQESSKMCVGAQDSRMNQSIIAKTSSSEKTILEAFVTEIDEPFEISLSGENNGKQNTKSNRHFLKELINMHEPKTIESTKITNENQSDKIKIRQPIEDTQIAQEHDSIMSGVIHSPTTNDEIVDALNQMFGEITDDNITDKNNLVIIAHGHNNASTNIQRYCRDNEQNDSLHSNKKTNIESLTMSHEVHIDNTITKTEKVNEVHIGNIPKTTDEIVTALKKIFGEPDDSMDSAEAVTENLDYDSPGNISIVPNHKDVACIEHHDDAINVSLRNGLSLMEESDSDTVVEGVVDMLSHEIIGDISVVTLNFNENDVKKVDVVEESIFSGTDTLDNKNCDSSNGNVLNSYNNYIEPNGRLETNDIECEDPVIDTCYVFSVIEELAEINEDVSQINECKQNADKILYKKESEDMKLIIPQHSYSYSKNSDNNEIIRRSSRNMKRKKDMSDIKTIEKKYRKGKNIDYPKTTASAIADLAYAKEYKRIIDYCSTIKFSYARPFHIESIDVDHMLKAWPIRECYAVEVTDSNKSEELLYRDTEDTETAKVVIDPFKLTLNEEIINGENINHYESIDINESNFNKGFGERSGRVIQKIETGITKLSAATLSDVKQYQPFSMSEGNKASCQNLAREIDTQKVKLFNFTNLISVKERVRSFFKNTEVELNHELLQNKKYTASDRHHCKFPFYLTSTEFMEVTQIESVVNVVQVGELSVSAAVQNSVTCDPRVTHVSDASPCSDNRTGDDTHATVETEYTELTTANITLPLDYSANQQQSLPSQDKNSLETNDDPDESSFSIVKIELMEETSQENLENDMYSHDFSPLPNNNVEYSFEDTSNTLFNTSVDLNITSKADNTSNNINTPYTNGLFDHTSNMDSAYPINNTPSSTESTYTNMDNASSSMYSTSDTATEIDDTVNVNEMSSNMDTTKLDDISSNNTYSSMYNPMGSDSNDVENSASNIDDSIGLENRTTDMNSTSNIESATYDYTYENIEDYAANIESNNNDNYTADVDNFDAVENYSANVGDYVSNVENYASNDESYRTGVEKYASSIENYATHIENYSTSAENYTNHVDNTDSNIDNNLTNINHTTACILEEPQDLSITNSLAQSKTCNTFQDGETPKVGHEMGSATIAAESVITSGTDELANLMSQGTHATSNNFSKSTPINVMTLQQALAHVLPPPLNQTSTSDNQVPNNPVTQQVLHIVQGNNAQTVINKPNGTHLLHIVQNKNSSSTNGLSLVDTGLQQGGNQLIHIVNNGNQNNAQFLKRVNLLTNLTNAQGSNEQKMIQLVCKSADGKSIQLNTGHQRSMVLRLQPTTVQGAPKPTEPQDLSTASSSGGNSSNSQDPSQDIKSRSVYEENYAQFIQNSGPTPSSSSTTPCQEKATSLPKFNQVFGKQSYQENQNKINNGLQDNSDCSPEENNSHLEHVPNSNPPLVARNLPTETTQVQPAPAQQIKQTLSPVNVHTTMHGGVIYTRQIPVNIGGRQTINLITVPSTELDDDTPQKQQSDSHFASQEGEQSSIIKLVPHHTSNNNVTPDEKNTQVSTSNEANHNSQPVLTQMRIKLPMLSKGHHIVPGARLVRPSFFQIQRNVIAGTNQPVYQQLVLTTAPPLGQNIRLPTPSPQGPPLLVQTSQHQQSSPHIPVQQVQHAPSSQHVTAQQTHSAPRTSQSHSVPPELTKPDTVPESELSTLTLEQLREFDMVLEQVKERSVQPTPSTTPSTNPCTPADSTDGPALATTSVSESTQQTLYSVENSQPTNVVSYVNRKSTITSATTSFVRSPDSSGIVDSPLSSTQVQITHTVTSKSSTSDGGSAVVSQPKKKKKKKSSSSSNAMAALGSPSKTNALKPQEDEQTTQRILYILAEYKEQVENSPDKNKPAPRRRNQFPTTIGSKRKRHCSSRSTCRREGVDESPVHGEPGEIGDDLITLGSEDSSCGTTFSECVDCQEIHSPESPTKVVSSLTFEHETTTQITQTQTSQLPQRNVIVGDRQTITVARTTTATAAKPTTTVLMPANYLLPVSMLKGGQQIAIMTNRGPRILVGAGDNNTSALLLQRLITPGLKPVLTRPGVRHIRLPTTTLHNLQAFNIQTTPVTQVQPPDSTAPQATMPGPPDLVDIRTMSSPWRDKEAQDKPTRVSSPDCTEPWNLPSSSIADDYGYEEIVRTDNMERTVLVVQQRKDGRHHRVTHVSTAALRHKYAILEHELRLQKSLSEECEDLGVDSPSASELFPEADILFGAPSPAHEQTIDQCSTPPPDPMPPQPDLDDQTATDHVLAPPPRNDDLDLNLDDVGEIVTVGEDGIPTVPTLNVEDFAKRYPNTTFYTEPEDGEVIPPFTIAQSIKGRHITYHANRVPGTVVMAPQTTVISQATVNTNDHNTVKFTDIDNMIDSMPCSQPAVQSVLVKDTGNSRSQSKFDSLKESGTSSHKTNSKADILKNSNKSAARTSSKFDSSKDLGTFTPRTKFDSLKDPGTSHRSSSKFDSHKDSTSSAHKPSSKFDSVREPRVSTSRSGSKFDSLKDPGISNPRPFSKSDKEPTGSRSYSKFDSQKHSGNLAPKPLSKFDSLLTESKLQLSSNTSARQAVHSTGNGTHVIRRLRLDDRTNTRNNTKFHFEEPRRRASISDEVKLRNDRAMVESMGDNASSPGQPELFWDSTTTERHERRFHFSESEKVTKSPFDELLNDSSAYGPHTRLDSVIKAARPERTYERTSFEGISMSGSSEESRPLRTYPPKRIHTQHTQDTERHFTLKTTTTTTHHHEVDGTVTKTTQHHEVDRTKKTRCQESEGRRRTGRGLVKRGCSCCNGSQSAPPKKRSRPKKPPHEFPLTNKIDPLS